mmetsp:Transcript_38409/g.118710  ORF Transcript_38409/g.118710 Transcript_38409/m.118710 type:complete len:308 (+) Transcript_38409:2036-2959(+)
MRPRALRRRHEQPPRAPPEPSVARRRHHRRRRHRLPSCRTSARAVRAAQEPVRRRREPRRPAPLRRRRPRPRQHRPPRWDAHRGGDTRARGRATAAVHGGPSHARLHRCVAWQPVVQRRRGPATGRALRVAVRVRRRTRLRAGASDGDGDRRLARGQDRRHARWRPGKPAFRRCDVHGADGARPLRFRRRGRVRGVRWLPHRRALERRVHWNHQSRCRQHGTGGVRRRAGADSAVQLSPVHRRRRRCSRSTGRRLRSARPPLRFAPHRPSDREHCRRQRLAEQRGWLRGCGCGAEQPHQCRRAPGHA